MLSTLFHIPHEIAGLPLFGCGWLLMAWLVFSAGMLTWLVRTQGWSDDTRSYLPLVLLMSVAIVWVLPAIEEVEPLSGQLIGLPIRGYGVMVMLGVVFGVSLAAHQARRMGIDPEHIFSLAFWMFVAGIIGARGFYVLQYWREYQRDTWWATLKAIALFTQGGLVVYGALIGGMVAAFVFMRRRQLPILAMCDLIAPSFALGQALGRVGCYLNGCCFGGLCSLAVGVQFPDTSPPYQHQLQTGVFAGVRIVDDPKTHSAIIRFVDPSGPAAATGITAGTELQTINGQHAQSWPNILPRLEAGGDLEIVSVDGKKFRWSVPPAPRRSLPVHPVQLYAAVDAAVLCLVLWSFYPFRRRDGEVFALMLTLHSIARFLQESIRDDGRGALGTGLTIAQLLSIAMFAAAISLWLYLSRRPLGSVLPKVV